MAQVLHEGTPWYSHWSNRVLYHRLIALGCHQNHEEDLRLVRTVLGATRSHIPTHSSEPRASGTRFGHLLGSIQQETAYLHGVHGWQPLPINEGQGTQMHGCKKCQEHTLPDPLWPRPYS